jgi:uncharacterized protein YhbP (UPF0306 family)
MHINQKFLSRNPDLASLADSLTQILEDNSLCTIATANKDGSPLATTVYFAADENLDLHIFTAPSTRHAQNIEQNAYVAAAIYDSNQPWGEPHRGIQLIGHCYKADRRVMGRCFEVYANRFPGMLDLAPTCADMVAHLESRLYVVVPSFIALIDEPRYGTETRFTVQLNSR